MDNVNNKIELCVTKILHEKFRIPSYLLEEEYWDYPLTGTLFQLNSIGMVYLFFELEKCLNLRIDSTYLLEYGFSSIRAIMRILQKSSYNESTMGTITFPNC